MTSKAEEIIELKQKLSSAPNNIVLTRLEAIEQAELAEELLLEQASVLNDTIGNTTKNLHEIALEQAQIRAVCLGAQESDVVNHNLGNVSTFAANTVELTYPTSSIFGIQIYSSDGSYQITLSSNSEATATVTEQNGTSNTFSTYYGNYYFVQSRKSGSLISSADPAEFDSILTPNPSVDFGTDLAFTETDLTSVVGTWNENYIMNSIDSISIVDDVTFVTLERALSDGYEESYSRPKLYSPLILKRKIADANLDAHTPFAVALVITEGMTINTSWLPVGDGSGDYSDPNANVYVATTLNNDNFLDIFGIYNPNNFDANNSVQYSLTNGIVSSAEEYPLGSGNYPYKNLSPFYPYGINLGELQAKIGDEGSQLSDGDIFCGRYVHIENDKVDNSGNPLPNYRFVVDTAAKFFYQVYPFLKINTDGTRTYDTDSGTNANELKTTEPQTTFTTSIDAIINSISSVANTSSYFHNVGNIFLSSSSNTVTNGNVVATSIPSSITQTGGDSISPKHLWYAANGDITANSAYVANTTGYYEVTANGTTGNTAIHYYYQVEKVTTSTKTSSGVYSVLNRAVLKRYIAVYNESTSYNMSVSITLDSGGTDSGKLVGPFVYNDVNDSFDEEKFVRVSNMIDDLDTLKINYDPNFEVSSNTSGAPDASSQTEYENFYSNVVAVKSTKDAFDTLHTSFINTISSGTVVNYSNVWNSFVSFQNDLTTFDSARTERITTIENRIGVPVYKSSAEEDPNSCGTSKDYTRIDYIPALDTSVANTKYDIANVTPYGTKLYTIINNMLDDEIGYFKQVVTKLNLLEFIYFDINKTRNQFEVLSNRAKQFKTANNNIKRC